MKLGMFGLVFFIGLGVALCYVGHDTFKSTADTVSSKVASLHK